jgi:hypothetical protein
LRISNEKLIQGKYNTRGGPNDDKKQYGSQNFVIDFLKNC